MALALLVLVLAPLAPIRAATAQEQVEGNRYANPRYGIEITKPSGWSVLNADDPRVFAMRAIIRAKPWVFSRDAASPGIREVLAEGGRATTVIDGWICVLAPDADPDPLIEVVDVPMTLAGLSRFNVEIGRAHV